MTKQFGDLFRRGLALLLCFCLVAGYIPVPGFAEEMDPHHPVHTADCGYREAIPASLCTHVHGTECYTMVTQCVHSHDASCYSDASVMEQGGMADACAHVCTEGSGCVTQVLNCTHVHDDACGYREAVPASPCTFVCSEDHSGSAQETTPEEPTEATEFTEPTDPTEETAEATEPVRLITAWTWVDPQEAIDPDTGMLLLSGNPETPVLIEQLRSILPAAILAQVDGIQETVSVASWHCDSYPAEGAYQGSFPFVAELPEGYILDAASPIVALTVRFDQPIALVAYEARVGEEYYESLSAALDAAAAAGAAVTLLKNASPTGEIYRQPDGTTLTIDLNGFILTGAIVPGKGAALKLDGSVAGSKLDGTIGRNTNVKLTISGGTYGTVQARDVVELNISSGEIDYLNVDQFSSSGTYIRWNVTGGIFHEIWGEPRVVYALAQGYCLKDVTKNEYVDLSDLTYHVGDQTDSKSIYTVVPCAEHTWLSDPTQEACAYCDAQNPSIPSAGMVAMVGDTYYETLQEAVEAAQPDGTVKVIRDCLVKSGKQVNLSSGTVTVDLNGKTVSVETAFMVSGGTLVLTSSNGIGKIDGDHCSAVDLEGGSLTVNGSVVLQGYSPAPAVEVTSGVLTLNQGATLVGGIRTSGEHSIMEYLAAGTAYAQCDYVAGQPATPGELVNGGVSSYAGNLVVVSHSHSVDSTGMCLCGFVCTHSAVDPDTGKCTVCKTQLYSLKLTANDSVTYYNEVNDALAAAADAAKSDENATLLLLTDCIADTTYETASGKSSRFVLDLNGHELGGTLSVTAFTSVHIKNGTIRTVKNEYGQGRALLVGAAANVDLTGVSIIGYEGAVEANSCYLTINSGSFDGGAGNYALTLKGNGIDAIKLNGGTFRGIQTAMPSLLSHLVGAVAYAGEDGSLFDASVKETLQTLTVVPHPQHTFDETGKCACGVAYEARLIANGAEKNYTSLQEAIRAAADYSNATVQLLRDVDIGSANFIGIGGAVTPNMTVTVDWNGHTLTGSFNVGTLVIAGTSVVTLTGAGGVTNTYAGGASTLAIDVGNIANVTILSGTYDPSVCKRDDAVLKVYGGVFKDSSRRGALASVNYSGGTSSLHDLLPDGKTLAYDTAGTELVDVYAVSPFVYGESRAATEAGRTVYVVDHAQHQIGSDGKCACGYAPIACVTAGESIDYFDSIQEAVDDAAGKTGSTLTLLKDVILAEDERIYLESGNFTIDWHGHTVHANTWKDVLTVSKSASLILSDTVGGGGITNTSQLSGAAVMFNSNPGYTLTITGGIYSPLVQKQGYGTMRISGGEFQNPQDSGKNYALQNDTGNLSDMLAPGYGFFYEDDNSLIRSYSIANTETNRTVTVAEHEHSLLDNSYCRCECGLICDQENLDENGYCATCGHTFVARTKTWERWPFMALSLFEQGRFNDAITHALSIQPKNSSDASIVQVLSDAVYDGTGVWNQNLDMELNGHRLTLNADVNVTAHVLTLYGGEGSSVDGNAVLTIGLGGMLNFGTDFGGTLQSKVVIENGVLSVRAGSTVHFNDLEVQENPGVTLSGGTYHSIGQEGEHSVQLGDLLGPGYVFQPIDDQKDPYRYKNSDSLGSGIYDVKVVACDHKNADGTLSYIDGVCDYCGQTCDHAAGLDSDFKCKNCGQQMFVSLTHGEEVRYFVTVEAALDASNAIADSQAETMTLLADMTDSASYLLSHNNSGMQLTLNLNGKSMACPNMRIYATGGSSLILTDSVGTGSSSVQLVSGGSQAGEAENLIRLESGEWAGLIQVNSRFEMTGGHAGELDVSGTLAVSNGKVDSLQLVSQADVTLTGGTFAEIKGIAPKESIPAAGLLKENYAYSRGVTRLEYASLPNLTRADSLENVQVVECSHGYWSSQHCKYCNHLCGHPSIMENGQCTVCEWPMQAAVAKDGETKYYADFCEACKAVETVEEGVTSVTLTMLRNATCTDDHRFSHDLTIDLNGHSVGLRNRKLMPTGGTTLTLKDSTPGGSNAICYVPIVSDADNAGTIIVQSGKWETIKTANVFAMTGGEVDELTFSGENSEIRNGVVTTLQVSNTNLKLCGGSFGKIQAPAGSSVGSAALLAPCYAFAKQDASGSPDKSQVLLYSELPTLDGATTLDSVAVIHCGDEDLPHDFNGTANCIHCGFTCDHTDETGASTLDDDGVCSVCGTRTALAKVIVNGESTLCKDIAEIHLAMGSAEDGSSITVKLLKDVGEPRNRFGFSRSTTVDLNGHNLNLGGFSISESNVTVTLVDTAENSTAKAEKLWLGGVSVTGSGYKVESGHWSIETFTGFHLWVTGGTFEELLIHKDEDAEGVRARISGGTVNNLAIEAADGITLEGGYFENVRLLDGGTETPFSKLLQTDHAVAENSKGNVRVRYDNLPTITSQNKNVQYYVVECAVGQRNHYYKALDKNGRPNLSTDTCLYCKHVCQHPALDENGKCTECQLQMAVEVTTGDQSVYRFQTLEESIEFVNGSADESLTLKLLSGCQLDSSVSFGKSLTLDLNGKNLTCADGVSLSAQSAVTLTLKDSAEGSTATAQGGIDCVAGSTVIVESGSWGSVAVNGTLRVTGGVVARVTANAGTVTLSGGEVTQLTEAGGRIEVSGGTVGTLSGSNDANILLSGGTFRLIQPEEGASLDLRKILAPDHCYQNGYRHLYGDLDRTTGYKFVNMDVAECTPHKYSDGRNSTGFCLYCNHQCLHPAINQTGVCTTCSLQMQASVTCDDMVTYYPTIQEAVKAATGSTAENVAVQLLSDAVLTEAVSIARDMTLDLNGKQFSVQDDSIQLTVSAGDFSLTDSGTGSGSCGAKLVITGGTVTMAGGKIVQITANGGTMTLSGGEVTQLTEAGGRIEVSGGTVGTLSGSNDANILLSGGTFKLIQPEEGAELDLRKILAPDHCYQNGSFRHPYEMLGYSTTGYKFVNMEVAECTPHEYSDGHISSTGFCLYCNHECLHEAGATNDFKCTECGLPFAASLAYGDKAEYFIEVYSAFNKASRIVLVNEATLTLLRDAELTKTVNHTSNVVLTVNENGKTLTAADGVSINLALEGVKLILTGTNDERTTVPFNISKGTTLEVQNGTWGAITVEGEGTLQMSGGTVVSIDATAASAIALISGGNTTGTLAVGDSSSVTLTGGTFGRIEDPSKVNRDDPASGLDFDFTKLLGTDREADLYYAFGSTRTGGMKLYEKLISDNQGCFDNMKVVLCEHIRGSANTTAYVDGVCVHCDRHCPHDNMSASGVCQECQYQMAARVTFDGTTKYYMDFASALQAAIALSSRNVTLTLLRDDTVAGSFEVSMQPQSTLKLELQGYTLTIPDDVNVTITVNAVNAMLRLFGGNGAKLNVNATRGNVFLESGSWSGCICAGSDRYDTSKFGLVSVRDASVTVLGSLMQDLYGHITVPYGNFNELVVTRGVGNTRYVSLRGGHFAAIKAADGRLIPAGDLLDSYVYNGVLQTYAYARGTTVSGDSRMLYADLPTITADVPLTDVTVYRCGTDENPHDFGGTDICKFCGRACTHETVGADGKCMACGYTMPIAVIRGSTTGYFRTFEEAVGAVNAAEAKDGFTIKLLKTVEVYSVIGLTKSSTLDLNGKDIIDAASMVAGLDLQCVNLTLKDSVPGSTAKAGFQIREAEPTIFTTSSPIRVESGNWENVYSSRIVMTGGHVGSLSLSAQHTDCQASISGGSIDMLWVGHTNVSLSGGYIGSVYTNFTPAGEVLISTLLAEDHAFASDREGMAKLKYLDMPAFDESNYAGETINAYIVPCTDHDWSDCTGYCIYCHRVCPHDNVVNGECDNCNFVFPVCLISADGATVAYYMTLAEAFDAAQLAENTGCTVKLLTDGATIDGQYVLSTGRFTLNLNGKTIQAGEKWNNGIADVNATIVITKDASVTFKGDGMVNPYVNLDDLSSGNSTNFLGGTYSLVMHDPYDSVNAKTLSQANHFVFKQSINGLWSQPHGWNRGALWLRGTATAMQAPVYLTVEPESATVAANATKLPANLAKLTASIADGWTVTANWSAWISGRGWVTITGDINLTSGQSFDADSFINPGLVMDTTYDVQCVVTATREGEQDFKFWTDADLLTLRVTKNDPSVTITPSDNLTYSGQPQALVASGSTDGGTLLYSLSKDGDYSTDIPTATDAGTYEVWYKVQGNDTFNITEPTKLEVVIAQAVNTWTQNPTITGWAYGDPAGTPSAEARFGTVAVDYRTADGSTYDSAAPTVPGDYMARFTVAGNANYSTLSEEMPFTVAKRPLTVTIAPGGGTYGGTIIPATAQLAGLLTGDTVKMELTYDGSTTVPTSAGTYTVQVTVISNDYVLTGETTADFVIAKAVVETPALGSKVYNGAVQIADVPTSVLYAVTKNNGGVNVGTYDVELALTDPANYQWDVKGGKAGFQITKAPNEWTLEPSISGWTYGEAASQPTGEAKFGKVSVTYSAAGKNFTSDVPAAAGAYTARFTVEDTENYAGLTIDKTLVIARREITVTITPNGGTYGGTITPAAAQLTGVLTADTVQTELTYNGSPNVPINAGTYTIEVTITSNDYILTGETTANFVIAKATVETPTLSSKIYNGQKQVADVPASILYIVSKNDGGTAVGTYDVELTLTDPANYQWDTNGGKTGFQITNAANEWTVAPSIIGWIYGDTASTPTGEAKYGTVKVDYRAADSSSYHTAVPTAAGDYVARFTVEGTDDYGSLTEEKSFTISKRGITVAITPNGGTYAGIIIPATAQLAGVLTGDTVKMELTYDGSTTVPTRAGIYTIQVTVTSNDYVLTGETTADFVIAKAEVETPALSGKVYSGAVQIADVPASALYAVTKNDGGVNVGTYGVELALTDPANYQWDVKGGKASFQITKAPNEWTLEPFLNGWTYGEPANKPVAEAKFGTVSVEYSVDGAAFTADMPYAAGDYMVRFQVEDTGNYAGLIALRPITIGKATVATPALESKVYNGTSQTADVPVSALYTVIVNNGGKNVGTYEVQLALTDPANYQWDAKGGVTSFSITDAVNEWTVVPSIMGWTYGDAANIPTGEAKFGTVLVEYRAANSRTYSSTVPTQAGDYVARFTVAGTGDYSALQEEQPFSIAKREITVTITPNGGIYGGAIIPADVRFTGVLSGDTVASRLTYNGSTNVPTKAGTYTVAVTVNDTNYILVGETTADFVIEKQVVETPVLASKVYTGSRQTAAVPASNLYVVSRNPGGTDVGTYEVALTLRDSANYRWDVKGGVTSFQITRAANEWTVTPAITGWIYGSAASRPNGVPRFGTTIVTYSADGRVFTSNVPTAAGSYTARFTVEDTANYTGLTAERTFTIAAKKLTVAITANGGVYNGTITPASAKLNGVISGDTVDVMLTYDGDASVPTKAGIYTIQVTINSTNYELTGETTAQFVIEKATVVTPALENKVYNGTNQTADVPASALYTVTVNKGGKNVGTYEVQLALTDSANYQWDARGGVTSFSITDAVNEWTVVPSITGWTYGDAANIPTGEAKFGTVLVEYRAASSGTYSSTVPTQAGDYVMRFTVEKTKDYSGLAEEQPFTIAKREVTIIGTAVEPAKVYDGTTQADIIDNGILSANFDGSNLTLQPGTAAFEDKNVGTGKTVAFTGFVLAGSAADNYLLTAQPAPVTADITAKDITLTVTVKEKSFDGTTDAEVESAVLTGVVDGDEVTLTGGKASFAHSAIGQWDISFEDFALTGADAGNYHLTNPVPTGVTAAIRRNSNYLDVDGNPDFDGNGEINIEGEKKNVIDDGGRYLLLSDFDKYITIVSYLRGADAHSSYPTGMKVYRIHRTEDEATLEYIPELDNLLQYAGCSIRVTGNQGIRMITALSQSNKAALTGSGLAGFTLEEYGTAVCWADSMTGSLTLGKSFARSNYAYKKGVADPVFHREGGMMQYTNVLVGFSLEECSRDMVMRPYITLLDADGELVTLYGGNVQRSIGYIAYQNRNCKQLGNAAYEYVWEIIHAVYGDAYDDEYTG